MKDSAVGKDMVPWKDQPQRRRVSRHSYETGPAGVVATAQQSGPTPCCQVSA